MKILTVNFKLSAPRTKLVLNVQIVDSVHHRFVG